MGVMKLFSSNSSSIYTNKYGDKIDTQSDDYVGSQRFALGDPQPHRFEVISVELLDGYTLAKIKYPDCQNFDGIKILIYEGDVRDEINNAKILDPHFLEKGLSPVARVKPAYGGFDAIKFLTK